jgi:hypothetical protein
MKTKPRGGRRQQTRLCRPLRSPGAAIDETIKNPAATVLAATICTWFRRSNALRALHHDAPDWVLSTTVSRRASVDGGSDLPFGDREKPGAGSGCSLHAGIPALHDRAEFLVEDAGAYLGFGEQWNRKYT